MSISCRSLNCDRSERAEAESAGVPRRWLAARSIPPFSPPPSPPHISHQQRASIQNRPAPQDVSQKTEVETTPSCDNLKIRIPRRPIEMFVKVESENMGPLAEGRPLRYSHSEDDEDFRLAELTPAGRPFYHHQIPELPHQTMHHLYQPMDNMYKVDDILDPDSVSTKSKEWRLKLFTIFL